MARNRPMTMLIPRAWPRFEGLEAAFGARDTPPPTGVTTIRQVHGSGVVVCDDLPAGDHRETCGDALVTARAGVIVAVKTADCVPILLVAPGAAQRDPWVAAVHAGWRGGVAGVIAATINDATRRGHQVTGIRAAIGPSIGPCCYEVGEEVASRFRRLGLPVIEDVPRPRLDLAGVVHALLVRAGVPAHNIEKCAPCTRCNTARYHSYRASAAQTGRQLSWIGWPR